jgi:hypothetical protein
MSLIRELKTNTENQINLVEILQLFCPEDKTKYVDLLLRMVKKTKNIDQYVGEVKETLNKEFGIEKNVLDKFSPLQIILMYRFIETTFNFADIKNYQKFVEYNERGLISENDLGKFKSFDDILNATSLAEVKSYEKDLERQIRIIYSDDEWVVLRPLTYHSSLKYGSSTKWCTASESNPDYFLRYSKRGIVIYMINKITGQKVACFKSLDKEPEFSFWNQVDTRIDSLDANLPDFILDSVKNEIKNNSVTNFSYLNDEDKKKQESLLDRLQSKMSDRGERLLEDDIEEMVVQEPTDTEELWEEDESIMEESEPQNEAMPDMGRRTLIERVLNR